MNPSATLVPLALLAVALPARAQTTRQALAAGNDRYLLADYHAALPLLSLGLDPSAGSPDPLWLQGVERLADVLLVLRQDSLAVTWLRWASRLAPKFAVNEDVMPPAVVRAARAARAFVESTPHDRFVARTAFEWPAAFRAGAEGTIRVAPANIPITARVGADQFLSGGESRRLPPGSYSVIASAPGYLPTRLTVEVLPGVTTVVEVSLLPETAGFLYVVARPWGEVFVDGRRIGYTAVAAHRLTPGSHTIRLRQDQGPTVDTTIVVGDRQDIRLAWVRRREASGEARLDSALMALDAGQTERGVQMLLEMLRAQPRPAGGGPAPALARLAEAFWSLGVRDSTLAYLRRLVEVDPFYRLLPDSFNPELHELYLRTRRQTPVISIRAPSDTVIAPAQGEIPIQIAVGQPAQVRLLLRLPSPRTTDSLLTTLSVDSVATASIPLSAPDGSVLPPGTYVIEGVVALAGGSASDLMELVVERLPTDTTLHEPPILDSWYRPQTRKQDVSLRSLLEGVGVGLAVLLVPVVTNDRDLSGRWLPAAAGLIGGTVALVHISLKRPAVPIPSNIAYNDSLRQNWQENDRMIAAENARMLRLASLRIRTRRAP